MESQQTSRNPDKTYGIYHDLTLHAPIEKVFSAVSEPEHLVNWWPLKCTGTPEIDEIYNFHFTPEYDWCGKVIDCELNQSFHIKMIKSDSDWNATTFGFEMEGSNEKIDLHFTHVGWPECNSHYRIASFCWAMLLKGLKEYIEKGIIVPFEERS